MAGQGRADPANEAPRQGTQSLGRVLGETVLGRGPKDAAEITPPRLARLDDAQNQSFADALKASRVHDHDGAVAFRAPLSDACPGEPELLRGKGMAFEGLKAPALAVDAFDAAVAAGGDDDPEVLGPRISNAVVVGNLARAAALLSEVPEKLREEPAVLLAEAVLHEANGRIDEAVAALDRADALAPRPGSSDLRAQIVAARGRFDELDPILPEWVRREPLVARPFYLAARSKLLTPGTPLFAAAEALAENPDAAQQSRAGACFALALAKDQAGEHSEAFETFRRANMQVNVAYDAEQEENDAAELKATMTADVVARAGPETRGDGLVFICGLPRSGSTLAETILSAHPEASAIGESQILVAALKMAMGVGYPKRMDGLSDGFLAELAAFYRNNLPGLARSSRFVIDKELTKFKHLGLLHTIFSRRADRPHTTRPDGCVFFRVQEKLPGLASELPAGHVGAFPPAA